MNKGDAIDLRFRARGDGTRRLSLGARGGLVEAVQLPQGAAYDFTLSGKVNYLALHDMVLVDGEMSVGGSPKIRRRDLRRTITYLPQDVRVEGWSHVENQPQSMIALYFHKDDIPVALVDDDCWRQPSLYFNSAAIEHALVRLKRGLSGRDPYFRLLADSISQTILVEFARRAGSAERTVVRGALAPAQVRAVHELIEAQVATDLSLEQLAAATGLSKHHFIRAFKAATGRTPYQALIDHRIERAKELLRSGAPVGQIANQLGYSSAADFSRAFSRSTGLAPSRYQRG